MRHEPASTERLLWKLLRDRRLDDLKFRRQVPIGPYIADFVCFRHRLVVEADGAFHDADRDARRDAWLRAQQFEVLRFTNHVIALYPDEVLDAIRQATGRATPHPTASRPPSPARGEGTLRSTRA
jgi:very-short-patch-repair endonuclease